MITYKSGVKSKASIFDHPIHPILVPFPIAFLVGLLISNIVYAASRDPFWAYMSKWLAMAGVVSAGLAAIFGIVDFLTIKRARDHIDGWIHGGGNAIALVISIVNTVLLWTNTIGYNVPVSLVLSAVTVAILLVTGWYGGELAYRYGIGVLIPETIESRSQEEPPYKTRRAA